MHAAHHGIERRHKAIADELCHNQEPKQVFTWFAMRPCPFFLANPRDSLQILFGWR